MITLTALAVIAALHLLFAVLAFAIARSLGPGERVFRYGWMFTAIAYLVRGLNMGAHASFSIFAFRSGPGTPLWDAALVVHPILNHSRTFMLTAYCLVLATVLVRAQRGRPLPPLYVPFALLLAGMAVGVYVGWNEEAFSALTHYTAVAVWDIMELLALMTLLFAGLSSGGMDRGLWASLGVSAFILALSVLWFASLSRIDIAGQWSPRPEHIHVSKAVLYLLMIGIAFRQLKRVRSGKRVRSFLESERRPAVSTLHG